MYIVLGCVWMWCVFLDLDGEGVVWCQGVWLFLGVWVIYGRGCGFVQVMMIHFTAYMCCVMMVYNSSRGGGQTLCVQGYMH